MNNIEWKEGAVCYAYGKQWFVRDNEDNDLTNKEGNAFANSSNVIMRKDFQLNEISTGDFIQASELDTEQKYNDVVEVFRLFGFVKHKNHLYYDKYNSLTLAVIEKGYCYTSTTGRQLTYHQIIAIGKLKRMMLEREKSAPKTAPDLSADNINRDTDALQDGNKYHREIIGLDGTKTTVDVYRVLDAFKTGCPATDHAIKKMLCAGLRGHKDKLTDYDNAIESLERAKTLLVQKGG